MQKDPVCGMQVDEETAADRLKHDGKTYYFCCTGCRERFEENPEKFIEAQRSEWDKP